MTENAYWLNDSYNDTYTFNALAGNNARLDLKAISNQTKLILEEARELEEAVAENNPVEVLDAVADLYVVLDGLTSKLVALGFAVGDALKHTNVNNLSKFPESEKIALASVAKLAADGVPQVTMEKNAEYNRFVIRDGNGKVRKPVNYVSNDLSAYVPVGFSKFQE